MDNPVRRPRSPGIKFLGTVLLAAALAVPLFMVYALVWDRQDQSRTARATITQGWGGPQTVTGPVLVIPYEENSVETTVTNGQEVRQVKRVTRNLYLSPKSHDVATGIEPERKKKSIYESVIYDASLSGKATFALPDDLARRGIDVANMKFDQAELHFGISDARGLQNDSRVVADGKTLTTKPGSGLMASGNSGFFSFVDWDGAGELNVDWSYGLRGSETLSLVPRGADTEWTVTSAWPHPSFSGSFLPATSDVRDDGFTATFAVSDLALGEDLLSRENPGPPIVGGPGMVMPAYDRGGGGPSMAASVGLVEPVDLYSQIDRSVKYGFLIIGFTFLAFLMFDIVAGASVSAPEYLLTGAGLVLFFVLLLAFAEVIGFAAAYAVASIAIIGLVTAYSAAVLKSWKRAKFIGALLVGLYALLFVLLSLEALSLLIGSVLLFFALAGTMYATRNVDWQGIGRTSPGID
ncbi:cell envelope integrity protein CreD [Croceicoccus sediminis]|uniref:cell envelope integrity protein CreD n=1 Tax=Croceicoccus sediminis TaxID=2571150 RepID=UPI001181FE90|nr:cell envelope integrity protein CreD [Croceicoccus sediminis]